MSVILGAKTDEYIFIAGDKRNSSSDGTFTDNNCKVFEVRENDDEKLVVKNPDNCVVFCRACSKTCGPDALSFPDKGETKKISGKRCITIDGCPAMCAAKSVEIAGGVIEEKRRVVDSFRKHRGAKPGTATELTKEGWVIADEIAAEVSEKVKAIYGEDEHGGE